jgi:hypothetical protein
VLKSNVSRFFALALLTSLSVGHADDGAGDAKAKPGEGYALEFAGEQYVEIPKLRYDGSHPITLEATVTPQMQDPKSPRSAVVANLELAGVGLHLSRGRWMFHVNEGRDSNGGYASAYSEQEADLNATVHLAGVYDGQNVRLFVNGKLQQNVDKTTLPHVSSPYDFMIGADPDGKGKPHQFFRGTIDEVHISKVARYTEDFTPVAKPKPDADTLVLYHFDEGKGEIAHDASENDNDGMIHDAKWVKEKKP